MADTTLDTPIAVPSPTTRYRNMKVSISISPRETGDALDPVDYVASIMVVPYRIVDGEVMDAPAKLVRTVNIGTTVGAKEGSIEQAVDLTVTRIARVVKALYA
jgi:hypothetical protein